MNRFQGWKAFAKKVLFLTACFSAVISCDRTPLDNNTSSVIEKSATTLTRAIYGTQLLLDPQFAKTATDASIVRDLLIGLAQFDPKGNVIPAIAHQWFTQDNKQWLFILDENAKWSNNEPVTAMDFVKSWQRLSDPQNASPLAPYLIYMGIKNAKAIIQGEKTVEELGIRAENSHTLQITLERENAQLPQMLAHSALLPTYQGQKPSQNTTFISNGSYRLSELNHHLLRLQANLATTPFQTVYYQLITPEQDPTNFDLVENPLNRQHSSALFPRLCTYFYEFNFNDPLLAKREIRQAIRAMLSPDEISRGLGIPLYSILPKMMFAEQERQLASNSPEQLLRQQGIDSHHPLNIYLTYDNHGLHSQVANRIARTLGQSDLFRIHLEPLNWTQLLTKRNEKQFQLIRSGWCADYADPIQFLNPFYSASLDNKSGYKNAEVDNALEQLQKPVSQSQRNQLISNIVYQLEQDIAILPIFQYQRVMTIDPTIQGYSLQNASDVIYSKDLYRQPEGKQQ